MFKKRKTINNPETINSQSINTECINVTKTVTISREQMISDIKKQAVLGAASAVGGLVVTGLASAVTALARSCSRKRAAKKKVQVSAEPAQQTADTTEEAQ